MLTFHGGLGCSRLSRRSLWFSVVLIASWLVAGGKLSAQVLRFDLAQGWQFRERPEAGRQSGPRDSGGNEDLSVWRTARVPGDVHLDLLAQKLIPDPFYGTNEAKLQWISKTGWEYRNEIDVPASFAAKPRLELVFEGFDAYAQVYWNDKLILTADNQFRTWRLDIKSLAKPGKNELRVVFPPPDEAALEIAKRDPWFGQNTVEAKSYVRKAAYEHGWDWGPTFVTSGIWRPVQLEAWGPVRIADFHVKQNDVSTSSARVMAQIELESASQSAASVTVTAVGPTGAFLPKVTSGVVQLHPGGNTIDLPLEVTRPDLWYPAGYGKQPLYRFTAQVQAAGHAEQREVRIGLRSLDLRRDPDQWGRSFEFVINGIPVFAKGADVIPSDSFANRVTPQAYRAMLQSAKDANMNMIRLWGGGYYETDAFYDLCDELGILVWHDFMFGNDWQPGTYDFKLNVGHEAEDQLRRLRNHPSIVLWSGNNETEVAFHWKDRDKLDPKVRLQMWQDYLTVFHGVLATAVAKWDPEVPYWPSSPSADLEPVSAQYQSGDDHVWDVWHGRVPFSTYETHHARFVSEYGFQSFPEMRTIESFTAAPDRTGIFTDVMLAHQKNNEGNSIIHDYLLRDYAEPKDFASFLYVSQILQAEGIKIGAEHLRRERPRTMGSIYWQLNDCWPVASWSSIDSLGRWKALQFYAKRFYLPVLVSPHVEGRNVAIYVVSDRTKKEAGTLLVQHLDFNGAVLSEKSLQVVVPPLSSNIVYRVPMAQLEGESASSGVEHGFVAATLTIAGETVSRNLIYLVPTKQVKLPQPKLEVRVVQATGALEVTIHSDMLARSVRLASTDGAAVFDDNYFDVLPGETRSVTVKTMLESDAFRNTLEVRSLADAFGT